MDLTVPDYAVLTVTLGGAVFGLFIGFSGALAFLAGAIAGAAVGFFGWPLSAAYLGAPWSRGLAVGLAALLAFGLVRLVVRKLVHGLVAQPGDALLGAFLAAVAGAAVSLIVLWGLGLLIPDNPDLRSVFLERALTLLGR